MEMIDPAVTQFAAAIPGKAKTTVTITVQVTKNSTLWITSEDLSEIEYTG